MIVVCVLVGLWLFAFGACVGSFLNVVIYRVPAGMSIVWPPSACPRCGTSIRSIDNIPLFSWLLLGGNCRACSTPISLRYPGMELLIGLGAAAIGCSEVIYLGRTLPTTTPLVPSGLSPIDEMTAILWGIAAFHFLLWLTLVAAAFIEYDGESVPWTLFLPLFLAGGTAPFLWPQLHPLPYQSICLAPSAASSGMEIVRNPAADLLCGLAGGLAIGIVLSFIVGLATPAGRWPAIAASAAVGLVLGWQGALMLGIGATILWPMLAWIARRWGGTMPWTGALATTLIPFLLAWKSLASWCP